MPIYEYECQDCGHVTSFMEKMFERPRLFGRRRRCAKCRGKHLQKIVSKVGASVERSQTEMLNELKSMGNVQFVPPTPKPAWGDGPPPGGCPYEKQFKEEQTQAEKKERDRKAKEPIVVS